MAGPVDAIRVIGRNTQGVRLVNLDQRDLVVDVARLVSEDRLTETAETPETVDSESTDAVEVVGETGDEPAE